MLGFLGAAVSTTKRCKVVVNIVSEEIFIFAKSKIISFLVFWALGEAFDRQHQVLVSYQVPASGFLL